MNKTGIEWVRNPDGSQGYTYNPMSGCRNCTPEGLCLGGGFPCYAYKLANGRLKQRYLANERIAPFNFSSYESLNILDRNNRSNPFYPRFWPERARESFGAYTGGAEPKGIFVCDMGDLFGKGIPKEWTRRILSHISMSYYREHRFYLLTKQPQNLPPWSPFPENCWVGVTATNDKLWIKAQIELLKVTAKIRFISFEPLLERMEIKPANLTFAGTPYIHWVIIGACTGTMKDLLPLHHRTNLAMVKIGSKWTLQPEMKWVEEIIRAADKAGVKVFLKNNLEPLLGQKLFYKKWKGQDREGHDLYGLRQEMPK